MQISRIVLCMSIILILLVSGCGPTSVGTVPPLGWTATPPPYLVINTAVFGYFDTTQWYVNPAGDDNNDCHSFIHPCQTIATALQRAADGETIYLSTGTFHENLTILKSVTINGYGQNKSIIDGSAQDSVVVIGSEDTPVDDHPDLLVSLSSLTIRNGMANYPQQGKWDNGGGIRVLNGQLTLWQVSISDNTAAIGGGIYLADKRQISAFNVIVQNNHSVGTAGDNAGGGIYSKGIINMVDSTISGNTSERDGGGIENVFDSDLTLDGCTLEQNSAARVGGALHSAGIYRAYDSTFISNSAAYGGAITADYMSGILERDTFSLNHASLLGGAIALIAATDLMIFNSTFDGNSALQGGAISVGKPSNYPPYDNLAVPPPEIWVVFTGIHLTITANQALPNAGGGVYSLMDGNAALVQTRINNTILSANSGGNCAGEVLGTGNLSSDATCVFEDNLLQADNATNLINTDPMLGPLAMNGGLTMTRLPADGSPAIDAANSTITVIQDQRGTKRPQHGKIFGGKALPDIGAVEVVAPPAHVVTPSGPARLSFMPNINANCRSGPDTSFPVVQVTTKGTPYLLDGQNPAHTWFRIMWNASTGCWVPAESGAPDGDTSGLRVLADVPTVTPVPAVNCSQYTTSDSCWVQSVCQWVVVPTGGGSCINK